MRGTRIGAAIAIAVVIGGCVSTPSSGGSGGGGGGTGDSFAAEYECNEFVKDRLKSPSTAHFPSDTSSHVGNSWTVRGSVDSENSFGASLRSTFTCKMTVTGDNWHLDDISINDGGTVN